MKHSTLTRRKFVRRLGQAGMMAGVVNWLGAELTSSTFANETAPAGQRGKADGCIFIWLGGGACHIDTGDPKQKGDPKGKKPGSYYDPIDTVIPGVQVCQHLPRMARLLDRTIIIRSVHHEVIDEHAAATNRLHVGRPPTGTTIYPSIGSVVAHQLGPRGPGVPAYVVMGYPSATRGPGFLGAQYGYIYLTDTEAGPAGLKRPHDVSDQRPARRLVEAGVRFVEVAFNLNFINGTGWDTHNEGQLNQHVLIDELDLALSTLITDLEKRGRLDQTLLVVATEFGRPPEFDGGGGRGHHSKAFSIVLAGGGLRLGQVIGQTDEMGRHIVEQPVSVPDLHVTIYGALGIDWAKELYDGERPVPITDQGQAIAKVFA